MLSTATGPASNTTTRHAKVLIVGGGAAGISVAARLKSKMNDHEIVILEPSTTHHYQPLWTLVGGGVRRFSDTEKQEREFIPHGVDWIQDRAARFDPDANLVEISGGQILQYDVLVLALGIQIDWNLIPGLAETLGSNGVCSNYSAQHVEYTWEAIQQLEAGANVIFTHPNTPIKCGGAPQKIMYLADEAMRRRGVRNGSEITFAIATPTIFAVEKYAATLREVCTKKDIDVRYELNLVALRPETKEAVFEDLSNNKAEVVLPYDMIHVAPPMSSPDLLKQSPFADPAGWVEVDKHTTQHVRFSNVFALGDCSNLPTSKTGAAVRKQAPVTASNVLAFLAGTPLTASYDGYTSCPLVTGYGKLVLAEFDYDKKPKETFPIDQSKERFSMYLLKKYLLPIFYWRGMLKGRM